MKKFFLVLFIVFLVFVDVVSSFYSLFLWANALSTAEVRKPVAILEDVSFGATRFQALRTYGIPSRTEKHAEAATILYGYQTELNGFPSEITLGFVSERRFLPYQLASVHITFPDLPKEKIPEVFQYYTEYFQKSLPNANFSYEKSQTNVSLDFGATGIYYTISIKDDTVEIDGTVSG